MPYIKGNTTTPENKPGILVDIASAASKAVNLTPEFIRRPWKRCIEELRKNSVDGIFAAIYQPQREEWARFPMIAPHHANTKLALWEVNYSVFQHASQERIWNGQDFNSNIQLIGTPAGYVTSKMLNAIPSLRVSNILPSKGLEYVSQGRLDGYVVEEFIGLSNTKNLGLTNIIRAPEAFLKAYWFLPLSHKFYDESPETADAFWEHIATERAHYPSTQIN